MDKLGCWFAGYTLVDITDTGVLRYNPELIAQRNQQRNWESVLQVIGLRAQPMEIISPRNPKMVSMAGHEFGSFYKGSQRCWKFMFFVEHMDVFGGADNPTLLLEQDFDQVPVITGLDETAGFPDPVFCTTGMTKNIYFKISQHLD